MNAAAGVAETADSENKQNPSRCLAGARGRVVLLSAPSALLRPESGPGSVTHVCVETRACKGRFEFFHNVSHCAELLAIASTCEPLKQSHWTYNHLEASRTFQGLLCLGPVC